MIALSPYHQVFVKMLIFGILSVAAIHQVKADDAELATEMLGQWRFEKSQLTAKINCISTFADDEKYSAEMTIKLLGTTSKVEIEGTWSITNENDVRIKITKSNNKILFPKGKILKKDNVKIKGKEMTYRHDGEDEKETRIEPKAQERSEE